MKGILCLVAALFLSLCLFSYHPLDPSFTRFVTGDAKMHNLIGAFGSYTADILIRLVGFGAFFLPIALFVCSYRFFSATRNSPSTEPWAADSVAS